MNSNGFITTHYFPTQLAHYFTARVSCLQSFDIFPSVTLQSIRRRTKQQIKMKENLQQREWVRRRFESCEMV